MALPPVNAGAAKVMLALALAGVAMPIVGAPGAAAKFAVTYLAAVMLTVQVPLVLAQAPPQPVKLLPDAGVAVSVTLVPLLKFALQVVPQEMPEGILLTVPMPVPFLLMVRVTVVSSFVPPKVPVKVLPHGLVRDQLPSILLVVKLIVPTKAAPYRFIVIVPSGDTLPLPVASQNITDVPEAATVLSGRIFASHVPLSSPP